VAEVLGLGLSQWIVQNSKGGVKSIEAKLERNIAEVAKLIPASPVMPLPEELDAPISLMREEMRKIILGREAPGWAIISMQLIDGARPRKDLMIGYRGLELPPTSVWLRLLEMERTGRIARLRSPSNHYDLTNLGVIALANWIVKHKRGTPLLKRQLEKLVESIPGQDRLF
jgi:hypothetical protein